jgi:hypothetical protein
MQSLANQLIGEVIDERSESSRRYEERPRQLRDIARRRLVEVPGTLDASPVRTS